jgi:hypothetical protein
MFDHSSSGQETTIPTISEEGSRTDVLRLLWWHDKSESAAVGGGDGRPTRCKTMGSTPFLALGIGLSLGSTTDGDRSGDGHGQPENLLKHLS